MNSLNTTESDTFNAARQAELLGRGFDDLRSFAQSVESLKGALRALASFGTENTARRVERMMGQLNALEPSVTMIGQIKSGKTSMVNALIGRPELLPADVNPWTSVVTSLHLHPESPGFEDSACFRFFEREEWDRLISGGGRIGELASRAGADDELEKIKQQVAEMREKSQARLGRKFEMLLGQQRDYGYFDRELIERFVCLGDDLEDDADGPADTQGRFADITKSADLNLTRAALPCRLCIRDTPGVNDTFMMREQITIRAIRDSRICVVVLSAHQALTSTDMALIRLISNSKSRDIVIFVNRIDELSDPARQIPQIKDSIAKTLTKHKGPNDAEVIFGSALWASYALQCRLQELPPGSKAALENWAVFKDGSGFEADSQVDVERAWQLSGVPELQAAIAERAAQGLGAASLQRIASSAKNLAFGLSAADGIRASEVSTQAGSMLSNEEARRLAKTAAANTAAKLQAEFEEILGAFSDRMERVQESFLQRATASLVEHLERFGEQSSWTYDPAGLRVLLNSSHKVLARKSTTAFENATRAAATEFADIYARGFSLGADEVAISRPRAPMVPSPVTLGKTIALDLSASWWKRWWVQRRGYKAYAASFYDLIKSETDPVVAELRDDLAQHIRDTAITDFEAFLNEQLSVFETLDQMNSANPEDLPQCLSETSPRDRRVLFESTLETLGRYAEV